jgi:protein tyrosine phosphatase
VYENYTSVSLPPVPLANLASYVEKKKKEPDGFNNEFSKLPTSATFPCTVGAMEKNILKNRFKNIKAYDHSRVVLATEDGDETSDYINASYITGYKEKEKAYVATQGPKPATVNDMWRLIWQVNTNRVVMVTTEYENGKRKCERYWPDKAGDSHEYGHVSVTTVSVEEYADYTVSIFNVSKGSTGHRQVMHFHFTSWQDKRIPDYAFPLLSFQRRVRSYNSGSRGPLLVHCSAGVGRTGTYLALDYLLQQAEAEKQVDVFGYVNLMRTQRMNMIQTLEQYIFVMTLWWRALEWVTPRCLQPSCRPRTNSGAARSQAQPCPSSRNSLRF